MRVLVTGGNRGLGLAITQALLKQHPNAELLLGSRDPVKGENVAKSLIAQGYHRVSVLPIDVDDPSSIGQAAQAVSRLGKLDVLVNNAGIAFRGQEVDYDKAFKLLRTNFYGVLHTSRAMLPLMNQDGRVVNISSRLSQWAARRMKDSLTPKLLSDDLTEGGLCDIMETYLKAFKDKTVAEQGFLKDAYAVAKLGVSMLTRIHARDNPYLIINCCCPGYIRTEMTGLDSKALPVEVGAKTPVQLCLLPPGSSSGLFWAEEQVLDWR